MSIQPIDKSSVHRICSGQVITDLKGAIKELVENSIDAGATCIDVRLKNHGLDGLEVADNGCGVNQENYQALTLKHWTSKLTSFADLSTLSSLGFRGEALSSLCAVSNLTIITRTASDAAATKLKFNSNGTIISQDPAAREVGTTVIVEDFFKAMPVRYKDLQRNCKRELGKALALVQSYAVIAVGVRITCSHQLTKGAKTLCLSTAGGKSLNDNIGHVFGVKQTQQLMHISDSSPDGSLKYDGFVSKIEQGCWRSSTDRQYVYLNKRPVDLPKVVREVNAIYKSFFSNGSSHCPVFFLDITLPTDSFDINVTPDKRKVFLEQEDAVCEMIKAKLETLYQPSRFTFTRTISATSSSSTTPTTTPTLMPFVRSTPTQTPTGTTSTASTNATEPVLPSPPQVEIHKPETPNLSLEPMIPDPPVLTPPPTPKAATSPFAQSNHETTQIPLPPSIANSNDTNKAIGLPKPPVVFSLPDAVPSSLPPTQTDNLSQKPTPPSISFPSPSTPTASLSHASNFSAGNSTPHAVQCSPVFPKSTPSLSFNSGGASQDLSVHSAPATALMSDDEEVVQSLVSQRSVGSQPGRSARSIIGGHKPSAKKNVMDFLKRKVADAAMFGSQQTPPAQNRQSTQVMIPNSRDDSDSDDDLIDSANKQPTTSSARKRTQPEQTAIDAIDVDDLMQPFAKRKKRAGVEVLDVPFEEADIKARIRASQQQLEQKQSSRDQQTLFSTTVESSANDVEQEFCRVIQKSDFSKMKVCGQFNLGFIITRTGKDLFIVDQHASDEKFNFERLKRESKLQTQKLISPVLLDLTPVDELLVLGNLEAFKSNGLEISHDPSQPSGRQLRLVAVPQMRNTTFGLEDVNDLIAQLTLDPHCIPVCRKIYQLYASRACRTSTMVGECLNIARMRQIVDHLGQLEQPWNCPHGRPTMRHLVTLEDGDAA